MKLREILKKSKLLMLLYRTYVSAKWNILSTYSPILVSKIQYKKKFGKSLNLKNPITMNEKLMWLKLNTFNNNPLVTKCTDKYRVREYVSEQGCSKLLNELIGSWESVDEIDWDKLPNKFAMKCNHGCGYNIICDDKSKLNIEDAKKRLQRWMKEDFWKFSAEIQYRQIQKRIICEKYLDTDQGFLPYDYKFYCFSGIPKAILVIMDRDKSKKGAILSTSWECIASKLVGYDPINTSIEKPLSFETMIQAATTLSKPFPFVRVDFYECNGKAVFGEITFTPARCIGPYNDHIKIDGVPICELLDIPNLCNK